MRGACGVCVRTYPTKSSSCAVVEECRCTSKEERGRIDGGLKVVFACVWCMYVRMRAGVGVRTYPTKSSSCAIVKEGRCTSKKEGGRIDSGTTIIDENRSI